MLHRPSVQQMGGLSRSGEADERRRERAKDSPRGGADRASRRPKQPERRPRGGRGGGERGKGEGETRADGPTLLHDGPRGPPKTPRECPKRTPEKGSNGRHRGVEKAPWSTPKLRCYVLICDTRTLAFSPVTAPWTTQEPSKIAPRRAKRAPKGFSNGATTVREEPNAAQEGRTTPQESPHRGSRQPKSAPRKSIISPIRTSM